MFIIRNEGLDENPRQSQWNNKYEDPSSFLHEPGQPGNEGTAGILFKPAVERYCQKGKGEQETQEPEMKPPPWEDERREPIP